MVCYPIILGLFVLSDDGPLKRLVPEIPVRMIAASHSAQDLCVSDGKLYASSFYTGRVSALDLFTGKQVGELVLDAYESVNEAEIDNKKVRTRDVHSYAGGPVAFASGRLFVDQVFSDSLLVVDPPTMRVIKRLPLGGEGNLAATPDGKTVVYTSNRTHEFHLIDPETYRHTSVAFPDASPLAGSLIVSPDGRFVLIGFQAGAKPSVGAAEVAGANPFLAAYDLREKKYAAMVSLPEPEIEGTKDPACPFGLAASPDGRRVYVGMFQSRSGVRVIDATRWKVKDDIRFTPNSRAGDWKWTNPLGMAFYRNWLFIANRENEEVVIVDPKPLWIIARLRFINTKGHAFRHILVEGDRIYLSDTSAVYELDGWSLARRLAAHEEKPSSTPLELALTLQKE